MDEFVSASDAEADFPRLLDRVAQGEEIVISQAGKPVARLVPYPPKHSRRRPGGWESKMRLADDWDSDAVNREIEADFEPSARPSSDRQ